MRLRTRPPLHPEASPTRRAASLRRLIRVVLCLVLIVSDSVPGDDPSAAAPPEHLYTPPGDSTLVIETFDYPGRIGRYPETWEGRSGWLQTTTRRTDLYYFIESEDENLFLRAETTGSAVNFGLGVDVNIRIYNRLRWRWRVFELPEDANETVKDLNDSAASVRLIFHGRHPVPKTLKYVWSTTVPKGVETDSPSNSRTKVVVLRSGEEHLGAWVWEDVDVYADYKRLFGGEPRKVQALAVITDSDNTNSPVKADYDDFSFWISPPGFTRRGSEEATTTPSEIEP